MNISFEDVNRVVDFFLRNYQKRFELFSQENLDMKALRSLNKGEKKIIGILQKNIIDIGNYYLEHNRGKGYYKQIITLFEPIMKILSSLINYLNDEKKFLDNEILLAELQKSKANYDALRVSNPQVACLESLNAIKKIDTNIKEKILNSLSHIGDIRNTWMFPAVFVELFGLVYASYNTLSKDVEWVHTGFDDFVQFYLIVVFLMISKMPDAVMSVYDEMIKKIN